MPKTLYEPCHIFWLLNYFSLQHLYTFSPEKSEDGDEKVSKMKIVSVCFQSNEVISIPDAYDDDRFTAADKAQDRSTGYRTKQMLCVPIQTPGETSLGVLQLVNTRTGTSLFCFF